MKIIKFLNPEAEGGNAGGGTEDIVVGKTFSLGELTPEQEAEETPAGSESASGEEGKETNSIETTGGGQAPASGGQENQDIDTGDNKGKEAAPGEKPKEAPQEKPELTLEEVLKGKDKREVLKALGVNEEIFDILDSSQSLSDLKAFVETKTKDWDAVPHEEILRQNLRKEYADLDDTKFEKIFKAEMKKYNLDSFDDEEKELGLIRQERDANKVRESLKAEQAQFKLPEPKASAEAQKLKEILDAQKQQQDDYDAFASGVRTNEVVKQLLQDKRVVIADGYNFEVAKPEELVESLIDTSKLFAGCVKDGKYDLARALKIVNYALNMDATEAAYFENAKSKINQETLEEHINPSRRDGGAPSKEEESLGSAFVNRGVHTTMGSIGF